MLKEHHAALRQSLGDLEEERNCLRRVVIEGVWEGRAMEYLVVAMLKVLGGVCVLGFRRDFWE